MTPQPTPWVRELVEKSMHTKSAMLEKMAAAFIQETGLKASDCELVEDMTEPLKVKYYFRKREDR